MADIVTFVPQSNLNAQANMAGFIEICRSKLTVFGPSLVFENDSWDVTETIELNGKHNALRMVFSNLETSAAKHVAVMSEPFKSFAKSFMRYQHAMRPTKNFSGRLTALRALEAALREMGTSDPALTNTHVLNRATQMLAERLAAATAYRTAGQLEMVADFLCDNRLMAVATRWRNFLKRPSDTVRVGKEADERRADKMPSRAALDGLPKVFLLAHEPADVLVSCATAILCSAPDRINELLRCPVDCEVRIKRNGSGDAYGLRWWPSKGAEPMVKWIIPSMVDVVEAAVDKIRKLTDEAREVARWYEENPGKLYLTEESARLRQKEWLNLGEIAQVVFAEPVSTISANHWCKDHGITRQIKGRKVYVRFADLEAAVLRDLPRGFPIAHEATGLKYRDLLFLMQRNTLHATSARMRCIIEPIGHPHIHNRLGARSESGIKSIFDRCGVYEVDGGSIRANSHQFRHYLNTLAQAGGMSQLDIAKWSGRKDVRQNKSYDHETTDAKVARIRSAVGDDTRMFGPLAIAPRSALITRDEFARLKIPTAHTTYYGYCVHDYIMSPCQMHRDCLNCGEQVCIKGEIEKEKQIRRAHAEATGLLAMAEQAAAKGEFGANEWVAHHREHVARIAELLEILDNPHVPNGSVVQLTPVEIPSRLDHAAEARALLSSDDIQTLSVPGDDDEVST